MPLYPGSKCPVYSPLVDAQTGEAYSDPADLHSRFKTRVDYLSWRPTNDAALHYWRDFGYNLGILTGEQRDGRFLVVAEFDVKKIGLSKDDSRAWRMRRISLLQAWETRVTMSPSGGFHAWFYANPDQVHAFLRRLSAEQDTDWVSVLDLTRGQGGMVAVPPSTFNKSSYFFLDDYSSEAIRLKFPIRDLSNEAVPPSPLRPDPVEEFLSGLDLRRKV